MCLFTKRLEESQFRWPKVEDGVVRLTAALTRKNALFAGSDGGAAHWAVIASLIETCKLVGVEPRAYLADVITKIVSGHPQSRLDELLPVRVWRPFLPVLVSARTAPARPVRPRASSSSRKAAGRHRR